MTNAELQALLKELPDDLPVVILGDLIERELYNIVHSDCCYDYGEDDECKREYIRFLFEG